VLRFNPLDPNLYARLEQAREQLDAMEQRLAKEKGQSALAVLQTVDREMKALLSRAFGGENDFEVLLQGVSLMAMAPDGTTVLENLMKALEPVLVAGAKACAARQVALAKAGAI